MTLQERLNDNLKTELELQRRELAAARRELDKLREQLARANRMLSGLPKPRLSRGERAGHIWAMCRFRACRHLARYARAGGKVVERPCVKCGRILGRGANARALNHIAKNKPTSKIAIIARNMVAGSCLKRATGESRAAPSSGNRRVPAQTTVG